MNKINVKKYLIMIAIGFILLALDIHLYTPLSYSKEYNNSNLVIGEFQYYTIASTYGADCTYKMIEPNKAADSRQSADTIEEETAKTTLLSQPIKVIDKIFFKNIRIDIASDIIGFLLIIIACFKLIPAGRKFGFAIMTAICSVILKITIFLLPFIFNGLTLCNITLIMGLFYLAATLLTVSFFTHGLLGMCKDVCCRDERKWCKTCWFITFILQIMITFIFWLGSDLKMLHNLGYFFEAVLIFIILVFWKLLFRTIDYIQSDYDRAIRNKE